MNKIFNDEDLGQVRDVVYKNIGNVLEASHDRILRQYLDRRLQEIKILPSTYIHNIKYGGLEEPELQSLLAEVLNHETYFFRDQAQYSCFADVCMPKMLERKKEEGRKDIKIWSAACSTGEEAYTLAMLIEPKLPKLDRWKVRIFGTDIDEHTLSCARKGLYQSSRVGLVPKGILKDCFVEVQPNLYQVKSQYQTMVEFNMLNFVDQRAMRTMTGFDVIFCKNVLFYFDDHTQKDILTGLFQALAPGGYLFTDYSLNISKVMRQLEHIKDGPFFYQKPL